MTSRIVDEIQAVIDKLHSEGHTVATRLENALQELKAHFTKDEAVVSAEVKTDVAQVATDAKPVVEEAKADAKKVAAEVRSDVQAEVEAGLAEAEDLVKKK